ncbi:MAG TPA: hypothetical protein VMW83_14325 [Spirochaetia bacterium]|nr:hypothetical protein [Spirochaetia bacterium]
MYVRVDAPRAGGVLTSGRAQAALAFLEACGGASEAAVRLVASDAAGCLKVLRTTGFARRCFLPGQEALYVPAGVTPPTPATYLGTVAMGWVAARAVEAGLAVTAGHIEMRSGEVYRICPWPASALPAGRLLLVVTGGPPPPAEYLCAAYADLRTRGLRKVLFFGSASPAGTRT